MGWYGPRGSCGCCGGPCSCYNGTYGTQRLYVEIDNVATNFACPTCTDGGGFPLPTVDELEYNGKTFVFDPTWADSTAMAADNVNSFDLFNPDINLAPSANAQCTLHGGLWECSGFTQFYWGIQVAYGVSGTEFRVTVTLFSQNNSGTFPFSHSRDRVTYGYTSGCPTGSYYTVGRNLPADNVNAACFDFRAFTAALTWA